jgi:dienelactone hydrolase
MGDFAVIVGSLRATAVLLAATVLAIGTGGVHAGEINECSIVVEDRAELFTFDARMADGTEVELTGILAGPDGDGPFPALVLLSGGNALYTPLCYRVIVDQLTTWGIVTLFVAPTAARDGDGKKRFQFNFNDLSSYGHDAALAAANLLRVDPARIGLWGHSRGGTSAIDIASGWRGRSPKPYRAAVAVAPWPGCPKKARPAIPLLVLYGAEDKVSPPDWCADFAERSKDASGFEFYVIPDAGHDVFWTPDGRAHLKSFLDKHLPASP